MPKIILASPIHDPAGRIFPLIEQSANSLITIFSRNTAISITPTTKNETVDLLASKEFKTVMQNEDTGLDLGSNYRLCIKKALDEGADFVYLIDFDRALHWARRFPNELRDIITYIPSYSGFISFMRTKRAFETHPLIQRSPETTINAIATEVAKKDVDIMSGAYVFDKALAGKIVTEGKRADYGLYAEFLTTALKNNSQINVMEVEGLEWETPDQFQDKIEEEGYSAWLSEFESLPEWEKRVKLIEESSEVLI